MTGGIRPPSITPIRVSLAIALVGSLALVLYAFLKRDNSQIPLLATAAAILGIVLVVLALSGAAGTYRAARDGQAGRAVVLAVAVALYLPLFWSKTFSTVRPFAPKTSTRMEQSWRTPRSSITSSFVPLGTLMPLKLSGYWSEKAFPLASVSVSDGRVGSFPGTAAFGSWNVANEASNTPLYASKYPPNPAQRMSYRTVSKGT